MKPTAALFTLVATLLAPGVVANEAPEASFAILPAEPELGVPFSLISTSQDADGTITAWTWSIDGEVVSSEPALEWTFTEHGDHVVTLEIEDDEGATSETAAVISFPEPGLLVKLMGTLPSWAFWVAPALIGLILIGVAAVVRIGGMPNTYNRVFFAFTLTSGAKSLTEAAAVLAGAGTTLSTVFVKLNAVAAYFLVPLFLWFVLLFPRPLLSSALNRLTAGLVLVIAAPFLIMDLAGLVEGQALVNTFNVVSSVIVVLSLGLMMMHARSIECEEERRRIQLLSIVFLLLVASTVIVTALQLAYGSVLEAGAVYRTEQLLAWTQLFGLIISPLMEVIGIFILMYAILRYQAMGIEVGLMRLTKGVIFAIVVPSVFIVGGNILESYVEQTLLAGNSLGFIIAGFIAAVALFPLSKGADMLTHKMFPHASLEQEEYARMRRMEIFEAQLRYSLLDGQLIPSEVSILHELVDKVGLQNRELDRILKRFPKVQKKELGYSSAKMRADAPPKLLASRS